MEPDTVAYNATIAACAKGGANYTQTALQLFGEMKEFGVEPNVITYNALISACGKGGGKYVDIALQHFDEMKSLGIDSGAQLIDSNKIIYTTITKACFDNERYPEAIANAKEAASKGFFALLDAKGKEWDLHTMREAEACMLVASALISSVELKSFRDICVITGRGNQSCEGPVLQANVPAFLKDLARLELSQDTKRLRDGNVNDGAFIITKESLQKWVNSDDFTRFKALMTERI